MSVSLERMVEAASVWNGAFILMVLFYLGAVMAAVGLICLLIALIMGLARPKYQPGAVGRPFDPSGISGRPYEPFGAPGRPYDPSGAASRPYSPPVSGNAPYNPPETVARPQDPQYRPDNQRRPNG